jgi:hypothetical protein
MTSFNLVRAFRHQQVLVKRQDSPNPALDIFLLRFQLGAIKQALIRSRGAGEMSLTAKKHGRFTTIPDDLLMFEVLACLPHQIPHMLLNSDVSPAHCTLTLQTSPSYVATMSRPV